MNVIAFKKKNLFVDIFIIGFLLLHFQAFYFHVSASVSSDIFLRNHLYNKTFKCEIHDLSYVFDQSRSVTLHFYLPK